MKDYIEFIQEKNSSDNIISILNEGLKSTLTKEEELLIDEKVELFVKEYLNQNKGLNDLSEELTNEGFLGSILGGLAGFALGSTIGKVVAKTLGVERGVLYDLLTSKLVATALGSVLGNRA